MRVGASGPLTLLASHEIHAAVQLASLEKNDILLISSVLMASRF